MKAVTTERVKELFKGLVDFKSIDLVKGILKFDVKTENVEKVFPILESEKIEWGTLLITDEKRSCYLQLTGEAPEQNEG